MGNCLNCEHWRPPNREPYSCEPINVETCTCPKIVFGWADYGADEVVMLTKQDGVPLEPDEANVADGSGYHASFHPGPEFGCIHFKEKQNGTQPRAVES